MTRTDAELNRRAVLLAVAAAAAGTVAGCGRGGAGGAAGGADGDLPGVELVRSTRTREAAPAADLPAAAAAVAAFSADLTRRMLTPGTNLICSPLSVHLALAMTLLGCRGRTADELAAVLHTTDAARTARGLNGLSAALAGRAGPVTVLGEKGPEKKQVALDLANGLWGQRAVPWAQPFLDALAADFGAGLRTVDFAADPEAARGAVNTWVSRVTRGTIPELVARGMIRPSTRLALVNALYLKAPWAEPFDTGQTTRGTFTRGDGRTVQAELMTAQPRSARYARGPGWQVVTLPYAGEALAMTLVLPDEQAGRPGGPAPATLPITDGASLRAVLAAPQPAAVTVTLPRWRMRTPTSLRPHLEALGAPAMFGEDADLSGMTTAQRLVVDAVLHEAFIAVDEAGTEAGAATAVLVREVSAPADPHVVRFDRPFGFVIHDLPSGVPLFLGQVADPTAG